MIDRFEIRATLADGTPLEVEALTVTLSDTWAPYVRGSLTCKLPAESVVQALDPRAAIPPRVDVEIVRSFGSADNTLARWTARALAPTAKVSEFTTLGARKMSWGTAHATHYNGAPVSGQSMRLALTVDELHTDDGAGILELTIGGAELRLQEYTAPKSAYLLGPRLRDAVNEALVAVGLGTLGAGEGLTIYNPPQWEERETAWDTLHKWLDEIDHRLIWDERGLWRIVNRSTTRARPPVTLAGLKELGRDLSRSDWYDAVEVWWHWEEPDPVTGEPVKKLFREPSTWSTSWTKVLNVDVNGQPKGAGYANEILARYRRKGEQHRYVAPLDLDVRPLDTLTITGSGGPRSATITAVTIALPAAEITVETREA
ncbi:hypothetical protein [Leucobacter sp. GX0328]